MKRLFWALVLALVAVACEKDPAPAVLDVAPDRPTKVDRAEPVDPIVKVSEPSTVFVTQGGRVRALIEWPHSKGGSVTVPLRTLDDGSGAPLTVGVRPGPAIGQQEIQRPDGSSFHIPCINCMSNPAEPNVKCCP